MLTTISLFFICSGFVIALIIANDLVQNKQSMKIMNVVWVLTALWASYLALWAYFKFGMETAQKEDGKDMTMGADMKMNMSMKDMPIARTGNLLLCRLCIAVLVVLWQISSVNGLHVIFQSV